MTGSMIHGLWNNPHKTGRMSSPKNTQQTTQKGPLLSLFTWCVFSVTFYVVRKMRHKDLDLMDNGNVPCRRFFPKPGEKNGKWRYRVFPPKFVFFWGRTGRTGKKNIKKNRSWVLGDGFSSSFLLHFLFYPCNLDLGRCSLPHILKQDGHPHYPTSERLLEKRFGKKLLPKPKPGCHLNLFNVFFLQNWRETKKKHSTPCLLFLVFLIKWRLEKHICFKHRFSCWRCDFWMIFWRPNIRWKTPAIKWLNHS